MMGGWLGLKASNWSAGTSQEMGVGYMFREILRFCRWQDLLTLDCNCILRPLMKFSVALWSGFRIRHLSLKQTNLMCSISKRKQPEEGLLSFLPPGNILEHFPTQGIFENILPPGKDKGVSSFALLCTSSVCWLEEHSQVPETKQVAFENNADTKGSLAIPNWMNFWKTFSGLVWSCLFCVFKVSVDG